MLLPSGAVLFHLLVQTVLSFGRNVKLCFFFNMDLQLDQGFLNWVREPPGGLHKVLGGSPENEGDPLEKLLSIFFFIASISSYSFHLFYSQGFVTKSLKRCTVTVVRQSLDPHQNVFNIPGKMSSEEMSRYFAITGVPKLTRN